MPKQQLLTLFFGNLVVWTVGNGLLPLLPIYGVRLGATPAQIGLYLAAIYFAMAVGTIAAGRLARRVNSYKTALLLVGVALRLLRIREVSVADLLPALLVAPLLVSVVAAVR